MTGFRAYCNVALFVADSVLGSGVECIADIQNTKAAVIRRSHLRDSVLLSLAVAEIRLGLLACQF